MSQRLEPGDRTPKRDAVGQSGIFEPLHFVLGVRGGEVLFVSNLELPHWSATAGIFSIYFHMTLSYVGQMLDELSILWTMASCYAFWFPLRYFPWFIKNR